MSFIVDTARALMAVMQPQTGTRASGTATITTTGANATIPMSAYAVPIIDGRQRADLAMKVGPGPNQDESWTVDGGGVSVDFISNLGGARHNIDAGMRMVFDPPLAEISSIVVDADFAGGQDPDFFGGVRSMVLYEQLSGPSKGLDLARSSIKAFPAVMLAWHDSEPADGSSVAQTYREARVARTTTMYKETYLVSVLSSRAESDHVRRAEGLHIMEQLSLLLTDRKDVDGVPFSNPSGVMVRQRYRETGPQDLYQKFYVYNVLLSVMRPFEQIDSRTYNPWALAVLDVLKPQNPPLPNQGDIAVVEDNQIDMDS